MTDGPNANLKSIIALDNWDSKYFVTLIISGFYKHVSNKLGDSSN